MRIVRSFVWKGRVEEGRKVQIVVDAHGCCGKEEAAPRNSDRDTRGA